MSTPGGAANAWLTAFRQTIRALAGWLLGYPLTFVFRRDPLLTLVIGRSGPVFADNSKHFFAYLAGNPRAGERLIFLATDQDLVRAINDAGANAVLHPSRRSLRLLLRCGRLVTDTAEWFDYGAYQLTRGAKLVQLWHGAPLKHIELDVHRARRAKWGWWAGLLLGAQKALLGRYPTYDLVVATSRRFVDIAFKRSFRARSFAATGYPRNDVLFARPSPADAPEGLTVMNVDEAALRAVKAARTGGRRTVLYVPTFRRDMTSPFGRHLDPARLSAFATRRELLIVMKLHPMMRDRYALGEYRNLIECDPQGDVYPLMALADVLITDYSSIFFDFLLLDRPIIFFAPDLAHYLAEDRAMYFEYDDVTPGPKCRNQDELEVELAAVLASGASDRYTGRRADMRRICHDHADGRSSARVARALNVLGT